MPAEFFLPPRPMYRGQKKIATTLDGAENQISIRRNKNQILLSKWQKYRSLVKTY